MHVLHSLVPVRSFPRPSQEQANGEKKKLRFMQKYWHKGAYFQDQADEEGSTAGGYDIFKRDFSAPTGEDRFDKAALPKVMQVRTEDRR